MSELLTAAQMRAIEKVAIDSGAVTGLELMERAGRGVADAIFEEWPVLARTSHRTVVLCGPGNNGGDGFVVARLLKERGWEVQVFLHGDPSRLPPDAKANHERWCQMGEVGSRDECSGYAFEGTDLVVDAVFGTGLSRTTNDLGDIWNIARMAGRRLVAVDIVSGVCADSGRFILEDADQHPRPSFDLTVTFEAPKVGHFLAAGPELCGRLNVVPLGISRAYAELRRHAQQQGSWVEDSKPLLAGLKKPGGHKFTHGHALILSGGPGRGGAARLAARGALRTGAGLVTLGCPPAALQENAAQLNAIMLKPLKEVTDLIEFLADGRINAVCLGPGLGRGERAQQLVTAVLAAERATVLDADALTVHEDDPDSLFLQLHEACVLTPHAGEFRRLFPDIADKLDAPATSGPAYSKVDATREAAARAGCTVLFKGHDTVIADATGRCALNASAYGRAAPWLATAGSGDVLAGFIAGLLARGFETIRAAETAAWLHTECGRSFGAGLIAEDLPEELPRVLRTLGL